MKTSSSSTEKKEQESLKKSKGSKQPVSAKDAKKVPVSKKTSSK